MSPINVYTKQYVVYFLNPHNILRQKYNYSYEHDNAKEQIDKVLFIAIIIFDFNDGLASTITNR